MRKSNVAIAALTTALAFINGSSAYGVKLLVNQVNPYIGYGVGLFSWPTFTTDLNSAFGGSGNVTITGNTLDTVPNLNTYDALIVNVRQPGQALNAAEIAPLQEFIASGKRVLLVGENNGWTSWDNSILGAVGGSYTGNDTSDTLTPVVSNSITAGVSSLKAVVDGLAGAAAGGTSLFNENVVTLWGSGNVLSLLSVNIQEDLNSNFTFDNNVANFLAVPAPEPASLALLAVGAVAVLARSNRRRPASPSR